MRCKRTRAFVLALLVLLALVSPALAVEDVFFVAVNDTIPLTLTGGAPYYSSDGLYVPYTVFDAAPGGVASAYNAADQTFVLFTRARRLIFDLAAETVTDEDDNASTVSISYRGGVLYVPLSICAAHFGLSTSMLTSAGGYTVLRFTTGTQVYEDSLFIEKAENLIAYRIDQLDQPEQPVQPPTPGQPPNRPVTPEPPGEDDPQLVPAVCYLAITDAAGMQAASDALLAQQLRAAFFLTAAEIAQNPELVRTLFVAGHLLGVRPGPDDADAGAALDAANDALLRVLSRKTVLALADPDSAAPDGYRVFAADPSAPQGEPEPGSTQLLVLGADAPAQIQSLLAQGATLALLRETTQLP